MIQPEGRETSFRGWRSFLITLTMCKPTKGDWNRIKDRPEVWVSICIYKQEVKKVCVSDPMSCARCLKVYGWDDDGGRWLKKKMYADPF
jgi:hypothetical protein